MVDKQLKTTGGTEYPLYAGWGCLAALSAQLAESEQSQMGGRSFANRHMWLALGLRLVLHEQTVS